MPKRRPVNKAFTGCPRCKASKVKCDETKPNCNRCTARALPCPGYPGTVIRWSTKHEVFNASKSSDPTRSDDQTLSSVPGTSLSFESASPDTSLVHRHPTPQRRLKPTSHTPPSIPVPGSPSSADESFISANFDSQSDLWSADALQSSRVGEGQSGPSVPWCPFIPPTITLVPEMLVSYYFQDVCSVFSSFDSDLNPFRSYVSSTFQNSAPVFNAMLSSSAARLADEMPQLKVIGLQYQSQALRCIAQSLKGATTISEDTLFAIFLVGLSTAWHDGRDIGLAHFHAAQRAITSDSISLRGDDHSIMNFFKYALVYWEMAISLVSDDVEFTSKIENLVGHKSATPAKGSSDSEHIRVTPHPWTGVSLPVQAIFSRVSKAIRALRSIDPRSPTSVLRYKKVSGDIERLEASLWSLELPSVADIDDTGDPIPRHHITYSLRKRMFSLGCIKFIASSPEYCRDVEMNWPQRPVLEPLR